MAQKLLPEEVACPHCGATLLLDLQERASGEFTCPECDHDIQLRDTPDLDYEEESNDTSDTITVSVDELGHEIHKGIEASKSYVGLAFLTLLLYYAGFYFVGLICNLIFISQANQSQRVSGTSPAGKGCLVFLIWFHLLIPIIVIFILMLTGVLASVSY